ncbi:Lrp/AsnC family transcriptional regulator [Lysinibacter cavernae]|uniref:DNA-binding Lrp family transcriptional regulator n=1 Tax=Lysinibacter cavernae TaxID=1640652 RepID=A0A7X5TUL8_9MICO|nr:Lrp/AsnC family transcriptional regulator [Lysinibacter cavernae]NIH54699.1 DNA-binding Lrp family transcriptional regulator [Lysinibacter cavernae]
MEHRDPLTPHVLKALREDGRASYTRIAASLGVTRKRVTQIVERAVEHREVMFTVSVSPDVLALQRFGYIQLRLDGPVAPVREALIAMPETTFIADISGDAPIDAEIRVGPDPHLQQTLDRIRCLPGVRSMQTHLYENIDINLYSPLRTGRAGFTLDATDRAIVEQLRINGRASFLELGTAAGVSPSGARLRLNRLVKHNAVKVVGIPVRHDGPNLLTLGVGIQIRGELAAALELVRSLEPEFLAITIGEYELIATLSADSVEGLLDLADRLRASPEIASIRTWTNLRTVKEEYGRGDRLAEG